MNILAQDGTILMSKDTRNALSSNKMEGEQLANFIKFLTNGFDVDKFDRGEEQDSCDYIHHKKDVVDCLRAIFYGMSANQLAKQKSEFVNVANKIFIDYYDDAEDYYDSQSNALKKRSESFVRLLTRPVDTLKTAKAWRLRQSTSLFVRDILDIYDDREQKSRESYIFVMDY